MVCVFRMHIYGISIWLLTQLITHAHNYGKSAREPTRAPVMYYTLILYCVYALVGGTISISDPYICSVHETEPTNRSLSSTGPLSVQCKRSYRLQN